MSHPYLLLLFCAPGVIVLVLMLAILRTGRSKPRRFKMKDLE